MRFVPALGSLLAAAALLACLLAFPAIAAAGDPCYHGFDVPALSEASTTEIKVAPCAFGPTVAHVAVGSTVTFFNGPGYVHLITGANSEWGSKDIELQPSQKVSYTFTKAGIYPYACALHRGMSGVIVVGSPSGVAADPAAAAAVSPARSVTDAGLSAPVVAGLAAAGGLGSGLLLAGLLRRRRTA